MGQIQNNSIDLVVTSSPYPMIEMWDDIMSKDLEYYKDCFSSLNYDEEMW